MKILHVVPTYLPATRYGGPIYSVHGLCKALVARGHEVHVFTTCVDGYRDSDVPINTEVDMDGVKVWYFRSGTSCPGSAHAWHCGISRMMRRLYYSPGMKAALKHRMREFDLVHLHSVFLWPTSTAARIAHRAHIPYVLSPRGMLVKELVQQKSYWLKSTWLRLIEKRTIEQAASLHVTSSDEAIAMAEFSFHCPSLINVANGVELPEPWLKEHLANDVASVVNRDNYVIYFGRVNWKKGLDRLLRAWSDVPDWKLVIAGNDEENYLPALQDIVVESGISERVTFISRSISGGDKEALLQSASLLVLPSYSENFGNVVPESMVRGVPVVVTEEVGAKTVVEASGGGFVSSAENLADKINQLLQDNAERVKMGRLAKAWMCSKLSWDKVAEEMDMAYCEVVKRYS